MSHVKASKNGYVMVYVSNATPNIPVYFDNFKVTHERGRILEESTYYPDGLKIARLCAKACNKLPNEFGYQGNYAEEEEESGYDEFALRHYDPTVARWLSTDPYDEFGSPYVGMGADPVNNVDPDGGGVIGSIILGQLATVFGRVAPTIGGSAQGTIAGRVCPSCQSASPGGGGISAGDIANGVGNAVAGYIGIQVAEAIFPLPKGPDASQLQSGFGDGAQELPGVTVTPSVKGKSAWEKDALYARQLAYDEEGNKVLVISPNLDAETQQFLENHHRFRQQQRESEEVQEAVVKELIMWLIPYGTIIREGVALVRMAKTGVKIAAVAQKAAAVETTVVRVTEKTTEATTVVAATVKRGRGLWKLTEKAASVIKRHPEFGKIFKSKSDGLWWAVDNAGHGGSKFKVFKETSQGLEWYKDADKFGDFIINKHKGATGRFIPWGQLKTIK